MLGLAGASWAMLWAWSASPYARYLDHGDWTEVGLAAEICRALPAGGQLVPALAYAGAWVLMIGAMMLPTTLPVLGTLRRVLAGRPDAARLFALALFGYLGAWLGFGLAAHGLDWALRAAVAGAGGWFIAHGWIVGAAVIAAAGLFQFSALKYRCLDKCRTPYGFVIGRWRGLSPARESWRVGFEHGLYCVGCCWALMLVMFAVGMGSLGWMLALGAVMAVEKNLRGGARLSRPLGWALIAWAAAIALAELFPQLRISP